MSESLITEIKSQLADAQKAWLKAGTDNEALTKQVNDLSTELVQLKANASRKVDNAAVTLGQTVTNDEAVKLVGKSMTTAKVAVGSFFETKGTTFSANAYIPAQHGGAHAPTLAQTNILSLMPIISCTSGSFDFARGTFTNAANMQGAGTSPAVTEGAEKAESTLSFTTVNRSCLTVAHLLPVSKQALDDMPQLSSIIDSLLVQGLNVKLEQQVIAGTNTGGQLDGIVGNATSYDTGLNPSSPNSFDKLRMSLYQSFAATNLIPSAIVLHPLDWAKIQLLKASTAGTYLISNPAVDTTPMLWGMPVIQSFALTAGTFLVGAFDKAVAFYSRQDASVEVSTSHADFFSKNLVAVRAELRGNNSVIYPGSFITGSL